MSYPERAEPADGDYARAAMPDRAPGDVISAEVTDVEKGLAVMDELAATLRERLGPVLAPSHPAPGDDNIRAVPAEHSPLAERIRGCSTSLEGLGRVLRDLILRLEI